MVIEFIKLLLTIATVFICKRNDGCLCTFYLSSLKIKVKMPNPEIAKVFNIINGSVQAMSEASLLTVYENKLIAFIKFGATTFSIMTLTRVTLIEKTHSRMAFR
jgi:hypothetical protein